MIEFSEETMRALRTLESVVDLREHQSDLDMMVKTNWKNENRKRGSRSLEVVTENTARGLGAEIALQQTGLFVQSSPITEDAKGLSFAQRKKDVVCEDMTGEIKTMNAKYPWWYISSSQCESVLYSTRYNDFFLIMSVEPTRPLVYRYYPKYLIDSKRLTRYIVKNDAGYSEFKFHHIKAISEEACIDLRSA